MTGSHDHDRRRMRCPRCGRAPEMVRSARGVWIARCSNRACSYQGMRAEGRTTDDAWEAWEDVVFDGEYHGYRYDE